MKRFFRKIVVLWYRMQYSESRIDEMAGGRFSVKYPDGKVSTKMFYKNAKSYKAIFGGEIVENF